MNRILQFVGSNCECCRARRIASRWETVAEQIDNDIGSEQLIEFGTAPAERIADGDTPEIRFYVVHDFDRATDLPTARQHVAGELLVLSGLLAWR